MTTPPPGISVLIRAFNSAKTLERLLSKLVLAEGDEILVVDSGSTDATLQIAQRHGAKIIVAPGPFNYSKSLNLGFRAASNPWVLVISSHCIPVVEDFLGIYRRESAAFPEEAVVGYAPSGLSGRSDPALDPFRTVFFAEKEYPRVSRVCGNANTIYRRRAWMELPFDETIRTAEDKLWLMEMLKRGRRFAYIPAARGVNQNQASLRYMFNKGCSDARALRSASFKPMTLRQLAGALKNLAKQAIRERIGWGNWIRYSAHAFGRFAGSHRSQDNTP